MAVLQGIRTDCSWATVNQSILCGRRSNTDSDQNMNSRGLRSHLVHYHETESIHRYYASTKCQCSSSRPETRGQDYGFQGRKCSAHHEKGESKNNVHSNATIHALLCSVLPVNLLSAPASVALVDENGHYSPSPMESPSPEIWFGFIVGVIPFIIASYEFGKRILIQRRCEGCGGRGLVKKGKYWKKCAKCGGMLPWLGWKAFWFSTFTDPGNGGPLLQPKGQGSRILYKVPAKGTSETSFDGLDNLDQECKKVGTNAND